MQSYQELEQVLERIIKERAELAEKLQKLRQFIGGATYKTINFEEKARLIRQEGLMTSYLGVLDERIAAFRLPSANG